MFALVVGLAYLVIGGVGFAVTGFTGVTTDGQDKLIGFDLNIFQNGVHLAIDFLHLFSGLAAVVFGILGARQSDAALASA